MAATSAIGDNPLFLLDYALRALRVLVLIAVWRAVLDANPGASPIPLEALLTYTLLAELVGHVLSANTPLSDALWQGTIANHYLRPMGIVRQFAAHASGRWGLDFLLFSLPLALLAPWLGVGLAPASAWHAAAFALSLVLAVTVGLALEFGFAAMTLVLDQTVWLVEWVRRALVRVLSGSLIPLAMMPWGLGEVFEWLPFASMAWAPLAIYTGVGSPLPLLALQLFWVVLLWPCVLAVWSRNREKVVAYGG